MEKEVSVTEADAKAETDNDDFDADFDPPPRDQDLFLTRLVEYSIAGVEIPVTLWTGGRLVTGIITSGKNFFEDASAKLGLDKEHPEGSDAEVMAKDIKEWADLYAEPNQRAPEWIHLKEAQAIRDDGLMIPGKGGVFWRGRLAAIDGFCFGRMGSGPG